MPSELVIIEQPKQNYSFKKQSDIQEDNIPFIHGINTDLENNIITYPSVQLIEYSCHFDVLIICTLYCLNKITYKKCRHPFRLFKWNENIQHDQYECVVNSKNNYKALIQTSIIISEKKINNRKKGFQDLLLDTVFLHFEAFEYQNGSMGSQICSGIFTNEIKNEDNSPITLDIIVQPMNTFSFRNESEIRDCKHGHIKGMSNENNKNNNNNKINKKLYPTVQLKNYKSTNNYLITCSPYCENKETGEKVIHSYRLVRQDREKLSDEVMDPYECEVNSACNFKMSLKATIIIPGKDSGFRRSGIDYNKKKFDLNKVYLGFKVFDLSNCIAGKQLCATIFSDPIGNQRCCLTNQLKILDIVESKGSCAGGNHVVLFCERVPQDIKVKFSEIIKEDNSKTKPWIAYGTIETIHKQSSIKITTPPYKTIDIKNFISVNVQLERKSDGALSESYIFKYEPTNLKRNASSDNDDVDDQILSKRTKRNCIPDLKNSNFIEQNNIELENKLIIIDEISAYQGSCSGYTRLFIVCKNLSSDDIKVRFSSINTENNVWIDYGQITKRNQNLIVCLTPPYELKDDEYTITVNVQLERISDGTLSNTVQFTYFFDLLEAIETDGPIVHQHETAKCKGYVRQIENKQLSEPYWPKIYQKAIHRTFQCGRNSSPHPLICIIRLILQGRIDTIFFILLFIIKDIFDFFKNIIFGQNTNEFIFYNHEAPEIVMEDIVERQTSAIQAKVLRTEQILRIRSDKT